MSGNVFGELFKVVTFGESHGPGLGCVIDGCPAGLELSVDDIRQELLKRRPGQGGAGTTSRKEADEPEILSGLFEGKTLGTPIAILVRNTNSNSADYDNLRNVCRPGHADFSWQAKYGIRDHRGGGRSSGRETLCRVAAGAVAKKIVASYGIEIKAWISSAAGIDDIDEALKAVEAIHAEGDSAGGIVSCIVKGVPAGLGEPVFGKLDARLAAAMLSVGAVKGIEFGVGFAAAAKRGSENNIIPDGILGGISTGQDIEFKVAFKPAPSIAKPQKALNMEKNEIVDLVISGRHDSFIPARAVPVIEAMTALVLADLLLLQRSASLSLSTVH